MPKTNAKDRDPRFKDAPNGLDRIDTGFRITRAIRQKDAIRLQRENVFGGRGRWNDRQTATTIR